MGYGKPVIFTTDEEVDLDEKVTIDIEGFLKKKRNGDFVTTYDN